MQQSALTSSDRERLLSLARRVREISELPLNSQRRADWTAHHDLKGVRPMVLIEAHELMPLMNGYSYAKLRTGTGCPLGGNCPQGLRYHGALV